MKFITRIIRWDNFDEDRWIAASITSFVVLIVAFFVLKSIRIPQNPRKVTITEEIAFVKPEVKKRIVQPKKIREQIPEEKVVEENVEIIENLFIEMPKKIPSLPQQNLATSDEFKIFEQENQTIEQSQGITQVTQELLMQESEFDPIDINMGLSFEWDSDNIKSTVITPNFGNQSLNENMVISSTIGNKTKILSNNFHGFRGDIEWKETLAPILDWINKNSSPIGKVPMVKIVQNDKSAKTARVFISVGKEKYELLLGSKIERKQISICMVNMEDDTYVMLVDQGLKKESTDFSTGKVRRNEMNEIINFRLGIYQNAKDPVAQKFMKIFWQWAKSVTERG